MVGRMRRARARARASRTAPAGTDDWRTRRRRHRDVDATSYARHLRAHEVNQSWRIQRIIYCVYKHAAE